MVSLGLLSGDLNHKTQNGSVEVHGYSKIMFKNKELHLNGNTIVTEPHRQSTQRVTTIDRFHFRQNTVSLNAFVVRIGSQKCISTIGK